MEKIIIKNAEAIMNGDACAVELSDGRKCTAWGDKIDFEKLRHAVATGEIVEVELKPYKSKAGKEGLNMVQLNTTTTMTSDSPKLDSPKYDKPKNEVGGLLSAEDIRIMAQCMTKCVWYGSPDATLGKVLDTYHEAVHSLEQNG